MFGHQDDQQPQQHDDNQPIPDHLVDEPLPHEEQVVTPTVNSDTPVPSTSDSPSNSSDAPTEATSAPHLDLPAPANDDAASSSTPLSNSADDLLDIKQQALSQLSPLVGHLDQTPEEKFRTTMMMIQANDNQALVKEAYAAAQQITDEKTRAQALLDIINEINYFTQHKD